MDSSSEDPRKKYESRYRADKTKYEAFQRRTEEEIREKLVAGASVPDAEGFRTYDSKPSGGEHKFPGEEGLFDPGELSFLRLGGFTAETLRQWIEERKSKLRPAGKKFLAIDWFGQGTALVHLGAERVIATTRMPYAYKDAAIAEKIRQINGEGLSAKVSADALRAVRKEKSEGGELLLGIWRPIAAFARKNGPYVDNPNENNLYVFTTLYNRFRNFYNEFGSDSLLFLSSFSRYVGDIKLLKRIIKSPAFPELNYLIVDEREAVILIRKPEGASSLPTEQEVLEKIPGILESISSLEIGTKGLDFNNWG